MEAQPATPRPRRRWLRRLVWAGGAIGVVIATLVGVVTWLYAGADVSTAGELSFANPLRIPEVDDGERGADGVVRYDLRVQAGASDFLAGEPTETWGVNGTYLGPTLRAQRGDEIEVAVANDVDETTSMHWHGMELPAEMDGGPHQPIASGDTWRPTWTVDQPATTLWYHPHPHGETADHVYRGVAGMFILDEPGTPAELPSSYGVDDVPVIVQDRSFGGDNQFQSSEPFLSNVGILGDELLVNGTHDPHLAVTTQRLRLRLLNASNARTFELGFVDRRPLQLIGTDGGLLPAPVDVTTVPLSPGDRAEVVVTMEPGERAVLRSFPRNGGGFFVTDRFAGRDDTFEVLELRAADELDPSPEVPARLTDVAPLDPSAAVGTREFRLSGTNINGRDMDMDRIDEVVTAGTTEVWEVHNPDGQAHNFHVHGVQFQVMDVDGEAPPAEMTGWQDTVEVGAGTTTRVVVPFGEYTDADHPYMIHCHLLAHEDSGMMAQFVVVEPGEEPGTIDHSDH